MATIPIGPLPYQSNVPNLSLEDMRKDFFDIWQTNVTVVKQIRRGNSEAGNYGSKLTESDDVIDKEIRINIQGANSDAYTREKYGIDTTSKSWHCYCLYSEDLANDDRFIWNDKRFILKNLNQGTHEGNRVFWEFDIISIDKDDGSFYA